VALLAALGLLLLPSSSDAQLRQRPMLWGAWIGDQITGEEAPWDMSAAAAFTGYTGKGPSLIEFSSPFLDCTRSPCSPFEFPAEQMEKIRAYGAIPFFSWSSAPLPGHEIEPEFQLSDLTAGIHDEYIRAFAEEARNWGHPFFLRFNWEMNGNWFSWSEGVNGNEPGEFVAAWRHVHDIFTAVGATNVTWVWCPYAYGGSYKKRKPLEGFYPGDSYVDWTCLDGYNWGNNLVKPRPWVSFDDLFEAAYRELTEEVAPTKPVMLGEVASNGGNRGKGRWLKDMFRQIRLEYRRIRGLIWFDKVDRDIYWPLEGQPAALSAFRRGVHRGYRPNIYWNLTESPIRPPK
jgi:Glycosyl hydrolase family 26